MNGPEQVIPKSVKKKEIKKGEVHEFKKGESFVATSDLLFEKISEEVRKVFPPEKFDKKIFLSVVTAIQSRNFVLLSPSLKDTQMKKLLLSLSVEDIAGNYVFLKMAFPTLARTGSELDMILTAYMEKLGLDFTVKDGLIPINITLPFAPVEVEPSGKNGHGQKAFICPEEFTSQVS